ncbi:polar amino acid transport system substrate-binding protein [Rhizobium sp. SG741]|nr:polar amino acid transport system substrate-binding protein [Rhizobium sp. SG741]
MRSFYASAVLASVLLAAGSAIGQEKLLIGTDATYPPFESLDASGNFEGFDIDIGKAICAEMKAECEFVNNEWDGMIPSLVSGKFDMVISSVSITPERLKLIDFSDRYYNTPPAVAVSKSSDIADIQALAGKTIGTQSATTHANYAEKHLGQSELRVYPTADEYKLDLANGRIDGAVDDVVVLTEWVKSEAGSCCKVLATLPIDPVINGEGVGVAVKKGSTLRDRLNAAIQAIRSNGTYKKINDKYFDFDAYGN